MILRSFELNKISKDAIFHLVYGTNEGLKTECINEILKKNNARVLVMMKSRLKTKKDLSMKIYYLVHYLKAVKSY